MRCPKMLLKTRASAFQDVFGRLGKAVCQSGDVSRSGACAKPNCFALLTHKPLTCEGGLAVTGRGDKNYVSALRLVEESHQPWPLNQPAAPSPFLESAWFCFVHANPRLPRSPPSTLTLSESKIRMVGFRAEPCLRPRRVAGTVPSAPAIGRSRFEASRERVVAGDRPIRHGDLPASGDTELLA